MRINEVHAPDRWPRLRWLIEEGRYCEARSELLIYCRELQTRLERAEGKAQIESLQAEWDEIFAETRTCVLAGRAHSMTRCKALRKANRFLNCKKPGRTWSLLG